MFVPFRKLVKRLLPYSQHRNHRESRRKIAYAAQINCHHSLLIRLKPLSRSLSLRHSYITGATVPSDHLPTAITNSVIGSGPSRNCGFSVTGESRRSAPQEDLSVSGK